MKTIINSKYFPFVILLMAWGGTVSGQTVKEDFTRINSVYSGWPRYSVNVTYTLFSDYTNKIPHTIEKGLLVKSDDIRYVKISTTEIITGKKEQLVVDHDNKIILVDKKESNSKTTGQMADLDRALSLCRKISNQKMNGSEKCYILEFEEDMFEDYASLTVIFDSTDYFIHKIIIRYSRIPQQFQGLTEKPRMEIAYSDMTSEVTVPGNILAADHYITKKHGKILLSSQFNQYRLIDHRNRK
jgi:hypothetical protein